MTELLTADVVVPDGIEPLLLARSWLFDGTHLRSPQQTSHVWMPGEPFHATCTQTRSGWWVERGRGYTRERAAGLGNAQIAPPTVELPPGFGYVWEERPLHDGCPGEHCTCGVYGTRDDESIIGTFGERRTFDPTAVSGFPHYSSRHMPEGVIVGSVVALWGKVIEGEKGARAEFGYPVSLDVPESLGDSDALRAYGVPINMLPSPASAKSAKPTSGLPPSRKPFWTQRKVFAFVIGANLGACAVNLSHVAGLW